MRKSIIGILVIINSCVVYFFITSKSWQGLSRKILMGHRPSPLEFLHRSSAAVLPHNYDSGYFYRGSHHRDAVYDIASSNIKPTLEWSSKTLNSGVHSASKPTPIADETGIYVGSDLGSFYKFSTDGKIVWEFKSDSGIQGIHSTAAVDENAVYFGNYKGFFYKLSKVDGRLSWVTRMSEGIGAAPLFWRNFIIMTPEYSTRLAGFAISLDRDNGKKVWVTDIFHEQTHSSVTIDESVNILGVGDNAGFFHGFELDTGRQRWAWKGEKPVKGTAALANHMFCFTTWANKFMCLESENGEVKIDLTLDGRSQASPAYDGKEFIYINDVSGALWKLDVLQKKVVAKARFADVGTKVNHGMQSPIIIKFPSGDYQVAISCYDTHICFYDPQLNLKHKIPVGGWVSGTFSVFDNALYGLLNHGGLIKVKLF